ADGEIQRRVEVSITELKLNEPLPDDAFDIAYAPGMRVLTASTNREQLVLDDGTLHDVSEPSPFDFRESRVWPKLLLLAILAGVAIVGIYVKRRNRGK
ncbi:MAG TPA: hypothetical protein VGI99_06300, partial [Gemmataceae bacterium]